MSATLNNQSPQPLTESAVLPLVDLASMHAEIDDEVTAGLRRVIASGAFVQGPDVGAFEAEFAAFSGRAHCIGTANGTDAVELALRACGIRPGAEVIVPANTFIASCAAVVRAGAVPVLVDVDEDTLLIDPEQLPSALSERTGAILPVHLFGQLAPMRAIQEFAAEHGLPVVEDAAQAQGGLQDGHGIGTGSAAAATSFYPGKNLGAYGDAGAVLTDSAKLAGDLRRLGNHGSREKYVHESLGFNSRLDTLQAVVLRAKLARLADWNEQRRAAAAEYDALLAGLDVRRPAVLAGNLPVWHLYVVRVPNRDQVLARLVAAGIGAGIHYPIPVHRQAAFAGVRQAGPLKVTELAAGEILSLPIYPGITPTQQARVVDSLRTALAT